MLSLSVSGLVAIRPAHFFTVCCLIKERNILPLLIIWRRTKVKLNIDIQSNVVTGDCGSKYYDVVEEKWKSQPYGQ